MVDVFIVFAIHCIADFPMQAGALEQGKYRSIYMLICHCAIYTAVMMLGFLLVSYLHGTLDVVSWNFILAVVFYSHCIVDYIKIYFENHLPVERYGEEDPKIARKRVLLFYCDQIAHLVVVAAVLAACIP